MLPTSWSLTQQAGVVDLEAVVLDVNAVVAAAVIVGPDWYRMDRDLMTVDHDRPLTQAQRWIEDNVPPDSPILVDDAIWVDLVRDDRPASRVASFGEGGDQVQVLRVQPDRAVSSRGGGALPAAPDPGAGRRRRPPGAGGQADR
jgi:hypothetical protein